MGNFLNKFYKNLKIVPLFLHFLYFMDTLSFFYLSLKFLPFSSPEDQEKKEKKSKLPNIFYT
jgi:hypothetical protein